MRGVLGVQLWLRYHDGGSCLSTVRVLGSQGCGNVLYRRRHSCAAIFDRCPLLFSRLLVRLAKLAQDAQARGEQTAPRSSERLTTNTVERERAHAPQTFYVKTSHVRRSWVGTRAGVTREGGGGIGNTPCSRRRSVHWNCSSATKAALPVPLAPPPSLALTTSSSSASHPSVTELIVQL